METLAEQARAWDHRWTILAAVELAAAIAVILLDLFIPTIIILGLVVMSLLVRREKISSLGFRKVTNPLRMALAILGLTLAWTLLHLAVFMPVLNHLTGARQDLSAFETLQGNVANLFFFLVLTWTLAAFGEEIVYRGYLQRRILDVAGQTRTALFLAVAVSSLLFGLAHTEQGVIGVVVTTLDAIFFSLLKQKYGGNLWAPVLAHGFSNTIGLVAFYFVGPVYGFW
jgi:membrane protease YdiL (CAAX protease family)